MVLPPSRTILAREAGLYAMEQALRRRGFARVAGADEAGRGACAGPLVAAAVILPSGRRGEIEGLNDSKLLTAAARERIHDQVIKRALGYAVIAIPPGDIDRRGLHVCNLTAMRRALASLPESPEYVLTDGFPVDGLGVPGLAVWKGDQVAACVAAASILAKVTRDRMMCDLALEFPEYGFSVHKGYSTPEHTAALAAHGPCPHHRMSYANVAAVADVASTRGTVGVASGRRAPWPPPIGENGAEHLPGYGAGDLSTGGRPPAVDGDQVGGSSDRSGAGARAGDGGGMTAAGLECDER